MTTNVMKQIQLAAFGACNKYGCDGSLGGAYQIATSLQKQLGTPILDMPKYLKAQDKLLCPCGTCDGYGQGLYHGVYRKDAHVEAYYMYEYPTLSKMTLWAAYGVAAMFPEYNWAVSSGYRCSVNNKQHGRTSTNHCGKAIDIRPTGIPPEKIEYVCDKVRSVLVESEVFQIGWHTPNKMSLEPGRHDGYSFSSPTWIHIDCRAFDRKWIEASMHPNAL